MTPKAWDERGYRFYFVSADCGERAHVHVRKAGNEAKYWIERADETEYGIKGCVELFTNKGYRAKEMKLIERILSDNLLVIRARWWWHCL